MAMSWTRRTIFSVLPTFCLEGAFMVQENISLEFSTIGKSPRISESFTILRRRSRIFLLVDHIKHWKMHEKEIRFTHKKARLWLANLANIWIDINICYLQNLKILLKSSSFACETASIFPAFLSVACSILVFPNKLRAAYNFE